MSDKPKCRNCGMELNGTFHTGVTNPETKEICKVNYYGGYVCSESCDKQACIDLERSMPGGMPFSSLSSNAQESLKTNWPVKI
jgi:hypothetical protein